MADVSYTPAAFATDQQAGFHNNPVDGVRSIRRIKRLAKEWGAEIIFTHDMEAFKGYALAPEPFTGAGCTREVAHEARGTRGDRHRSSTGHRQRDRREAARGGRAARGRRPQRRRRRGGRRGAGRARDRGRHLERGRRRAGWRGETLARYGKIDVLVNAAAIVPFIPWDEVDFAYWRKIISVNLDGAYLVSRAVERPMREAGYGRIVQIASNAF